MIDELVSIESFGWLQFTELESDLSEIPSEKPHDSRKSPSQRLHDRMFVYHKKKHIIENYDIWYKGQLEKIGNKYLDQLEE